MIDSNMSVVVVGAGPAGLMAAKVAALRGHKVVLFDQSTELGGQLNLAKQVPGKEEFHGLVAWFTHETHRLGVETRLGAAVDVADLAGFDQVIVASGVSPRDPQVPGQERAKSYLQVLQGAPIGKRVAIVGAGGIGFDVAEYLVANGPSATLNPAEWRKEWGVGDPAETPGGLLEPAPEQPAREVWLLQRKAEKPGRRLGKTTGWIHRATLQMKGVKMIGGVNYERIDAAGLHVSFGEARENPTLIEADTIVLCAGQLSERSLADALAAEGVEPIIIGGADVAAELDAKRAIDQGTRVAAAL